MGGRRWVPVATALLVVVASAASAAPAERPAAKRGLYGSVSTTTPAGGSSTVTSGKVPRDIDTVDILLGDEELGDSHTFKQMTFALMQLKSKGHRTVLCALMAGRDLKRAQAILSRSTIPREQAEATANNFALASALMCMKLARLMSELEAEGSVRSLRAARGGCDVAPISLKIHKERTEDGGVVLYPAAKTKDGTKALRTKVTCKGKREKLTVGLDAKKGRTLRSAVGNNLKVGLVSPSDAEDDAHITVGFTKG